MCSTRPDGDRLHQGARLPRAPRRLNGAIFSFPWWHRWIAIAAHTTAPGGTLTAARATMTLLARAGDSPSRAVDVTAWDAEAHGSTLTRPIAHVMPPRATLIPPRADRRSSPHGTLIPTAEHSIALRGLLDCPTRTADCHTRIGNRPVRTVHSRIATSHSHRISPKPRSLFGAECATEFRGQNRLR